MERATWTPTHMPADGLSVIVLSFNEAANIQTCLRSLKKLSDDIWVVDSGSTDDTVALARAEGVHVVERGWPGYAAQWNWALSELPMKHPWVLLQASDEQIPDAWALELQQQLDQPEPPDMVLTRFEFWWMGRPVRHGKYGKTFIVKAGRRELLRYEDRSCNEHIPLQGRIYRMNASYIHRDAKEIDRWVQKHIQYARLEAEERLKFRAHGGRTHGPRFWTKSQSERVRWLRHNVYDRLPVFVRPMCYFAYRYVLGAGWRDGLSGFTYHVLHGLWFPFMIDVYELELRRAAKDTRAGASTEAPAAASEPAEVGYRANETVA